MNPEYSAEYTYFAKDGNYGNAKEIEIIETSGWSLKDWDRVQEACDSERVKIAREIEMEIEKDKEKIC